MTEIPKVGPVSLTAAIDAQIEKLKQLKLPSLRAIHSAKQQCVNLSFDRDRAERLTLRAPNGRPAHPGHLDVAESWVDMLQAAVRPAELLKLKAKVTPSKKGVAVESAAYLAATVLAVGTWPVNIPYPLGTDLYAVMRLKLRKEGGETVGDVWVDIGAVGGSTPNLDALSGFMPSFAQDRGYYWQRCCEKLTPWFEDGGIRELSILVPLRPAGEPFDGVASQGTATIH
jgi:hypothetical protein